MSSSASSSPEPAPVKSKKNSKGKEKRDDAKNEGTDPNWAYKPPPGTVLVDNLADSEQFDWDSIDDGCELWLIRVPNNVS